MNADSESLTPRQLEMLQRIALDAKFTGRLPMVSPDQLEEDGRKRRRVIRDAIANGFVDQGDGSTYKVSQRILSTIDVSEFDLFDIWKSQFDQHESTSAYARPWICISSLPFDVQMAITLTNDLDWYVVSTTPYNYHASFADEAEHVLDTANSSQRFSAYWAGPFEDLESAIERLRSIIGTSIAVSSSALRNAVDSFHHDRTLDWQFANNVLWGLVTLGLVPEDELFTPDETAKIDAQLNEGQLLRRGTTRTSTSSREINWESNLGNSIQRLRDQIERQEKRLALLQQIDAAIHSYGGWDRFQVDYRAALEKELINEAQQQK